MVALFHRLCSTMGDSRLRDRVDEPQQTTQQHQRQHLRQAEVGSSKDKPAEGDRPAHGHIAGEGGQQKAAKQNFFK